MKNDKKFSLSLFIQLFFGIIICLVVVCFIEYGFDKNGIFSGYFLIQFALSYVIMIISAFVHTFIHEFGHYIGGKISGYYFCSFRIFSHIYLKENDKLIKKRFTIKGTAGQCLMVPPEQNIDEIPYKLYLAAGRLHLALTVTASLFALIFHKNIICFFLLVIFALTGLMFFFLNIIPTNTNGLKNDGMNIRIIGKSRAARSMFFSSLWQMWYMANGVRVKNLPREMFTVTEEDMTDTDALRGKLLLQAAYHMDCLEFSQARAKYDEILRREGDNLPAYYRRAIYTDLLMIELLCEFRPDVIRVLFSADLVTYLSDSRLVISKALLQYAYALLYLKNNVQISSRYNEFINLTQTYPYRGEIENALELFNYMNEVAKNRDEQARISKNNAYIPQ